MQYYKINPEKPDPQIIIKAVKCLENGGIIVYPTDTLYGLGVDANNRSAVNKLFLIKQRDMRRPVSLLLNSIRQIKEVFGFDPPEIEKSLKKIMPGRVTAVINNKHKKEIPILEQVSEDGKYLSTVGVRVPDHPVSSAIANSFDSPISSTSANISGMENVFSIQQVIAQFSSKLDLILDAGPIPESKGSTIIDFTRSPYLIVREGDISEFDLKDKLGPDKIYSQRNEYVITFVCSGNICRSPLAEAILKKMISKTKYKKFIRIQSAGTLKLEPTPAHDYATDVSRENDIFLYDHVSKPMNRNIIQESDIVICLAQNHFSHLVKRYPQYKEKIVLLKQWRNTNTVSIPSIADPIGHNYDFFIETFNEIRAELKRLLPLILGDVKRFTEWHKLV